LDKTSYEFWNNKKPSLKYFKVLRCLDKVNISITKKRKISPKIIGCTYIYRFLVLNSKIFEIANNIIIELHDTIFLENIFSMKNKLSKPVNKSSYFKIDIVNNHASDKIRKIKINRRAKVFVLIFISFYLKINLKHTLIGVPFLRRAIKD